MAAKQVLASLEKRADAVRACIRTSAEDSVAEHQATPIASHAAAYAICVNTVSDSDIYQENVRRCLDRIAKECKFARLAEFNREGLKAWMVARDEDGMGARTRNAHGSAIVAFCNWCIETSRLTENQFSKVRLADEKADPRPRRRPMAEADLVKLLDVARSRPLAFGNNVGSKASLICGCLTETPKAMKTLITEAGQDQSFYNRMISWWRRAWSPSPQRDLAFVQPSSQPWPPV